MSGIDGLSAALQALPLRVDDAAVQFGEVALASYAGGPRPSSTVTLSGGGLVGRGEHVGWTVAEHDSFSAAVSDVPRGRKHLGEWIAALAHLPLYDRAALEAAAIDLALRQHDTNLFRMAGASPRPVRYVVSFARFAEPAVESKVLAPGDIEVKVDADPRWTDEVYHSLASLGRIAVLDFKMQGEAEDHERACRHLPQAWIEDPKPSAAAHSPALAARVSADAVVTSVAALAALLPRPAAVNVKPARMGSVLAAIECLARCRHEGLVTYIGGMFEVGIGRMQLRALAALACFDGPNDIAPLLSDTRRPAHLFVNESSPGYAQENEP